LAVERLVVEDLHFSYGRAPVLRGVSLTVKPRTVTTLMGANACGKTTLLLLMTKHLRPDAGRVLLDGRDIAEIPWKDFARRAAVVHQSGAAPDDLPVRALVAYGRAPHTAPLRGLTRADEARIDWAMEATGVAPIAGQALGTLSGGQRQRAFLAMALAQDTGLLFLDEPTAFLDVRHQVETLRLVRQLGEAHGLTIVMVLHDINQALMYSDEVIGLKDGRVFVQGPPADVIDRDVIFALYGIRLETRAEGGRMWVLPVTPHMGRPRSP
jgi:iron complex transport system ATP-binding protein